MALEISGVDLYRAVGIFSNLTGSNTNPTLQAIDEEYASIFSAHNDKIYLNSKLYQRIKEIDLNSLKGEDKKLTEYYLQQFELAGANLSAPNKEKMKKINSELATLGTSFGNKLLTARKNGAVLFDTESDLDGVSIDEIAAAKTDTDRIKIYEDTLAKYGVATIDSTASLFKAKIDGTKQTLIILGFGTVLIIGTVLILRKK